MARTIREYTEFKKSFGTVDPGYKWGCICLWTPTNPAFPSGAFGIIDVQIIIVGVYPNAYNRINDPFVYYHGFAITQSYIPGLKMIEDGFLYSVFFRPPMIAVDHFLSERFWFGAHLLHQAQSLRNRLDHVDPPDKTQRGDTLEATYVRMTPMAEELEEIKRIADDAGLPLLVLLINHQETGGEFEQKAEVLNSVITEFCNDLNVSTINPLPTLRSLEDGTPKFRLGRDHHWSPLAHRVVAREIARFLVSKGFLNK